MIIAVMCDIWMNERKSIYLFLVEIYEKKFTFYPRSVVRPSISPSVKVLTSKTWNIEN